VLFGHRFAAEAPTGVGRYAIELAAALRALPGAPEIVLASAAERRPLPDPLRGAPVAHLRGPRAAALGRWLLLGRPLLERTTGPADVVHVLAPFVPVPTRAPLVVTVHDLFTVDHPDWYRAWERAGYRRGLAQAAREAAAVIAVSESVAHALTAELDVESERIAVIPEGVSDAFRRRVGRAEQEQICRRYGVVPGRFVIAVGSIEVRKNMALLVQAARDLDVTVLMVGAHGDGWLAVEEAQASGGAVRVRAPGYVDDDDLAVLVASARLLAHPSLDEGYGLPPLEAMAAGTPVVAAPSGALPETAGDAALWVDPYDVSAWKQTLASVLADDALHAQLVAAGRARTASLTWERAAMATLEVYRSAVRARRA
jgi:glycosyltransferase involved in cell wall biosynthesis